MCWVDADQYQHTRLLIPKIEFIRHDLITKLELIRYGLISINYTINSWRLKNGSSSPFLLPYATNFSMSISIDEWYLSNALWKVQKLNS
jgi:hypothetical protein